MFQVQLLCGVYEYLKERLINVSLYSECGTEYVEVIKNKHVAQIDMHATGMIDCHVHDAHPKRPYPPIDNRLFDIADPSSLQAIYEYVSSKRWK